MQTLATDALSSIRCVHCHNDTIRPGGTNVVDLIYQPLVHVIPHLNMTESLIWLEYQSSSTHLNPNLLSSSQSEHRARDANPRLV